MLPVTISASLAFVLPVATPPNAIVFAYGDMQIIDMVKAGVVMNIVTLLILQVSMNTYTYFYFNLGVMPAWALSAPGLNTTLLVNSTNLAEM
jgi:sodium-dependent dicarboxylate transporter 2/3/5